MFEQAVLSSGPAAKRVWTTSVGVVGQALVVGGAVLLTMVWPQALPMAMIITRLEAPGPPPPPPPPGPRAKPELSSTRVVAVRPGAIIAPISMPPQPAIIVDPPPASGGGVPGGYGVAGGTGPAGVPGAILSDILKAPSVPTPTERPRAAPTTRPAPEPPRIIRVSELRMARLIHKVDPIYPHLAKQARVQGEVRIEAIVAVDGRMRNLRVVSGHHLLIPAALDAVRQWIYEPTVLNGERVEVSAPIIVIFKIN